jgi:hypothetical protein
MYWRRALWRYAHRRCAAKQRWQARCHWHNNYQLVELVLVLFLCVVRATLCGFCNRLLRAWSGAWNECKGQVEIVNWVLDCTSCGCQQCCTITSVVVSFCWLCCLSVVSAFSR